MSKRLLAILILLPFAVQCTTDDEPPENVIDEETYIDLLVELNLTRNLIRIRGDFHSEDSLRQEVFSHYGIDRSRFEKSHAWYEQQPHRQIARMDTVADRLRELRAKINEAQNEHEEQMRVEQEEMEEHSDREEP